LGVGLLEPCQLVGEVGLILSHPHAPLSIEASRILVEEAGGWWWWWWVGGGGAVGGGGGGGGGGGAR
jgi:hypothetical protein